MIASLIPVINPVLVSVVKAYSNGNILEHASYGLNILKKTEPPTQIHKLIMDIKTKTLKKTEEAGFFYWENIRKNYGIIETGNKSRVYTLLVGM
ncbi:MAG: hypothetical protein A2Y97_09235 [Nitrospirae bacterium RBG_13_39_12]|nr:MAG: hypothetical protein A2Y97_09235 [Nitrospirae bacterium RBG_13_39_12]